MMQNPYEILWSLKQTASVEEFRQQFEPHTGPLQKIDLDGIPSRYFPEGEEIQRSNWFWV